MKRLDGKIAVVTGASSGIGRAIAEHFVAEGAKVVAFARNADSLQTLEAAHPGQVIAVCGDVTRQEDLERLLKTTVDRVGAIDILVPNAGIARVASFADSTAEVFAAQFSVNFFAAAETARLFVPHIRKGGSIQFITTFDAGWLSWACHLQRQQGSAQIPGANFGSGACATGHTREFDRSRPHCNAFVGCGGTAARCARCGRWANQRAIDAGQLWSA